MASSQWVLVDSLIERLFAAEANKNIGDFLRGIRDERKLTSHQLRVSGTEDDLKGAIRQAINSDFLSVRDLARHVDEVEENGNQHVFLFDLTDLGAVELTSQRARSKRIPSTTATENAYDSYPADRLTWHVDASDRLVLKQVYTASFWRKNESESTRTDDREVIILDRIRRRAVNMLVVESSRRRAEVRLSRVEGSHDSDRKAVDWFGEFITRLDSFLDVEGHLTPTPIWDAFYTIATNREEIAMFWDRAAEARLSVTLSDRLLGRGGDVRDHPDYRLRDPKWARKELRVSWIRGVGSDAEQIPAKLSEVKFVVDSTDNVSLGKVEIFKPLAPDALKYVIGRIRHFTAEASGRS